MNRKELAAIANEVSRLARYGGAPKLTEDSSRETVLKWCLWCDPNGLYTDKNNEAEGNDPLDMDEAWSCLEDLAKVFLEDAKET